MTTTDFNNNTKDNWRRWAWNQHKKVCPRGGTALIMAGSDTTREVRLGRDRGFSVVCCDINEGCVADARKNGEVAIWDDVKNQIECLRPKVVTLDFMGGLNMRSMSCIETAFSLCESVVVNMLRGRDGFKGDSIVVSRLSQALNLPEKAFPSLRKFKELNPKHRGVQTVKALTIIWDAKLRLHLVNKGEYGKNDQAIRLERAISLAITPTFYSYRSRSAKQATLYYDSVHLPGMNSPQCAGKEATKKYVAEVASVMPKSFRKAAAAKANLRRRRNLPKRTP